MRRGVRSTSSLLRRLVPDETRFYEIISRDLLTPALFFRWTQSQPNLLALSGFYDDIFVFVMIWNEEQQETQVQIESQS